MLQIPTEVFPYGRLYYNSPLNPTWKFHSSPIGLLRPVIMVIYTTHVRAQPTVKVYVIALSVVDHINWL